MERYTLAFLLLCAGFLGSEARVRSRIVGGGPAIEKAWPWQGALKILSTEALNCGCSLLKPNYAITAAHCVTSVPSYYLLVFGTNYHNTDCPDTEPCQKRNIQSLTRHPGFINDGSVGWPNDVAVVYFEESVLEDADGFIRYATLATKTDYTSDNCKITGWGRLYGNGPLPEDLQEANTYCLSYSECLGYWPASQIHEGMHVCVFDRDQQLTGACNGDSGGPLVCEVDGEWEVIGTTSWGRTGCLTSYPSVYQFLGHHLDWINENTPDPVI